MGWLCWETHMGAGSRPLEGSTAGWGGHSAPPGGAARHSRWAAHPQPSPLGTRILWNETGTTRAVWIELQTHSGISGNANTVYKVRHTLKGTICTRWPSASKHTHLQANEERQAGTNMQGLSWSRTSIDPSTYPCRLKMLPELIHRCVWDAHVPEHSFQFRCELTSTFSLKTHKIICCTSTMKTKLLLGKLQG